MNKLKTIFRSLHWKNILGLTIAGLINAFGITIFLSPVNLYDSGISGTSMLLSQITPEHLSLSVFLIILNIPLFLYGWKKQGSTFTIYAIYVVAIYSLGAWLITDILPIDVRFVSPLAGSDLLPVQEADLQSVLAVQWTVSRHLRSYLPNALASPSEPLLWHIM